MKVVLVVISYFLLMQLLQASLKIARGDGEEDSESDGTGEEYTDIRQSTPKDARQPEITFEDDTVPEEDYVCMNTTETGDTIQSSAFIDMNKEERREFQVGDWNDLEKGDLGLDGGKAGSTEMELQFQNLSTGHHIEF